MGRRVRAFRLSLILITCLLISGVLSGCDSSEAEETTKNATAAQTDQQEQVVEEEVEAEDIPGTLLPGQQSDETSEEAAEGSEVYQSNGETGTADSRTEETVASNGNGTSNSSTAAGSGSGGSAGNSSSQQSTISVQFVIDSSAAGSEVSANSSLTLSKGATVYDALAASGVSHTGSSYIQEIGGLWEKDYSASSGWTYYVNGNMVMKSCTKCVLQDGDVVQWVYVV